MLSLLTLSRASLVPPAPFSPASPLVPPGPFSPASPLVLPGSSFEQQLSYRTANGIMFLDRLTAYTYQGGPLRGFDLQTRSQVLASIVRGCDEEGLLGEAPRAVVTSGSPELGFDWQRTGSGVRVACRGAQLVWNIGSDRWEAIFCVRVPTEGASAAFDELLLAICAAPCHRTREPAAPPISCSVQLTCAPSARKTRRWASTCFGTTCR